MWNPCLAVEDKELGGGSVLLRTDLEMKALPGRGLTLVHADIEHHPVIRIRGGQRLLAIRAEPERPILEERSPALRQLTRAKVIASGGIGQLADATIAKVVTMEGVVEIVTVARQDSRPAGIRA